MTKPPKYRGTYHRRSRALTKAAKANPRTPCWRCGLTLQQVQAKYPTRRVHWTAGHTGITPDHLAPECSPCNYADGARRAHTEPHTPW